MSDIKCRYAFDENDSLVNIDDVIKEERHLHKYRCVACGEPLLAKIGNVKVPHFAHDKDHACDGETYLHELAKHRLKERFEDKTKPFYISYEAEIICKYIDVCKWKNVRCDRQGQIHRVDLKKYYDTAKLEQDIEIENKKYKADVLLTNSKKQSMPPILLEIWVSHECELEKKGSGLRIIEFRIKSEKDINDLVSQSEFHATPQWEKKKRISFYSFNKIIKSPLVTNLSRFVMSESKPNGYVCYVPCISANYKVDSNSLLELNAVNSNGYDSFDMWDGQRWMWNNKGFRLCGMCANYYKDYYENKSVGKCRLSRQVGTPAYPNMRQAEFCKYGRIREDRYSHQEFHVEQVNEISNIKEDFHVALIHEFCGDIYRYINLNLFEDACDKFLYEKFKSTKITFIEGFSEWGMEDAKKEKCALNELCSNYAFLRNIRVVSLKECLVPPSDVKNLFGEFVPSKRGGKIHNLKDYIDIMLSNANALIVIWDETNQIIAQVIEEAKKRKKEILEFDERIWNYSYS